MANFVATAGTDIAEEEAAHSRGLEEPLVAKVEEAAEAQSVT
ncbi:hypothetical protein [Kribbella turkmenica]|nr:hypothetical protein [Kribbella turkmenica]